MPEACTEDVGHMALAVRDDGGMNDEGLEMSRKVIYIAG